MTKLLIVSPAFNEAAVLPELVAAVLALRQQLARETDVRLLVVDDGSIDNTVETLRAETAAHPDWVSFLSLAANAGHQAALIAGLTNAGPWPDIIVTIDADLEHPIAVVPQLIAEWRRTGAIVVHAIRRQSRELPWRKRLPSLLFYKVTAMLTGLQMVPGQADFRLWDANVLRGVAEYLPRIDSLRVFGAWLPGRKASVEYDQVIRDGRESRFTLRKNLELFAVSIVRFSHFPLKAITALGVAGLVFAIVYGAIISVQFARGITVPGWASTVLTVMVMGCLQLIAFGVLATYLRRLVFARDLPPYIVREARLIRRPDDHGPESGTR
jgi:dolichol-phosphate mannosyltransferase